MGKIMAGFKRFWKEEEGATAVEYGLMVALIAAVIIGTVTALGGSLDTLFGTVGGAIDDANTAAEAGIS